MFLGADTDALRAHGELMTRHARAVRELLEALEPAIMDPAAWRGPDADAFRQRAAADVLGPAVMLSDRIAALGRDAGAEAAEQDATSEDGAGTDGAPGIGPDALLPFLPGAPNQIPEGFADDVKKELLKKLEEMKKERLAQGRPYRSPEDVLRDWLRGEQQKAADERRVLTPEDMARIERDYQQPTVDPEDMKPWPAPPLPPLRESTSPEERRALDRLAAENPAGLRTLQQIQNEAAKRAYEQFGPVNQPAKDHQEDAFRHAYMNATAAQRLGQRTTEDLYTAHEQIPAGDTNPQRMAMDLHNNEVGRRLARQYPDATPEEMANHVADAVRRGEMVIVDPKTKKLVPSNRV